MLAMLWANQIIMGKRTYDEVPRKLKPQVKQILEDAGCGDLVTE